MKTTLTFTTFFIASTFSYAQRAYEPDDKIYQIVEQQPEFPGGEKALMEFLKSVPYPAVAAETNITGSVYVRFIVGKDGVVSNLEIAKGADKILNDAALEHLSKMPAWKPGYQNGKPVRVQYIVPFNFKLQEDKKKKK